MLAILFQEKTKKNACFPKKCPKNALIIEKALTQPLKRPLSFSYSYFRNCIKLRKLFMYYHKCQIKMSSSSIRESESDKSSKIPEKCEGWLSSSKNS